MDTPAISIRGLSAWYGQARALDRVNLDVAPGRIVGLLGRNGAGKSTLLRSIAGLHQERIGEVRYGDFDASRAGAAEIARRGVSFVREGAKLPMSMTVEENLENGQLLAGYRGRRPGDIGEMLERIPILAPLRKRAGGVLSGGQRQALALAVAFISKPTVLLLDEPSGGLSPQTATTVFELIGALAAESGATVIVVEQNSVWLDRLGATTHILNLGAIDGARAA